MRHALVGVLALAACAVLAGAMSLLAVGEWIADWRERLQLPQKPHTSHQIRGNWR
ncbi:hypothetical protein [Streptomyces sp. NPDC058674]|uniref:hypothetical protein n=1 Tax=Streptomyces sp. NPDC058674 TaxID=3346592 RepID=UPI003668E0AB